MFLHISEASSQDIEGFFKFLLSKLVYSQMWQISFWKQVAKI